MAAALEAESESPENAIVMHDFLVKPASTYTGLLPTPTRSVFLFGPRWTGRSTWIRDRFPGAATCDLLDTGEALRLSKDPSALYRELAALPAGDRAVIDEVQKVPGLLDEVHRLIESHHLRFVLSASSARKLRRGGANLLAGHGGSTSLRSETRPSALSELAVHRPG